YRNTVLDKKIRKERTRAEGKLLKAASLVVNTPKIIKLDEDAFEIVMEFINGPPLKEIIEKDSSLCSIAGKGIRKIHDIGIIHGDLTTSNIIYLKNPKTKELKERVIGKGPLFFIDFGLGFFSKKLEDKAADLVVFKKTFNATHSGLKNGWELVMKSYAPDAKLIERMAAIEKRARYH
ncbi:MAG: KEOPS complex kinase/ATPase Bud32, partial [archaeon]